MQGLSIKITLHSFYLLISYFEKLSTSSWRLPFAVKVIPNHSNERDQHILSFLFRSLFTYYQVISVLKKNWFGTPRLEFLASCVLRNRTQYYGNKCHVLSWLFIKWIRTTKNTTLHVDNFDSQLKLIVVNKYQY